ncbi:MAG TPA: IS5 family transposase [Rhodospirillales bacterium]|nr:IS5 family transposase [Rhodospirillales bacterium]
MLRHRLTDEQWDLIADIFPEPKRTGRPPRDRRQVVNGILWILRTGSPWRDLPEAFGPWATVWDLFDKWNEDGTLQAILDRLRSQVKIDEKLWCIDGTIVRAAKCAAGGGKKTTPKSRKTTRSVGVAAV